jgi:hypothetical protein
VIHAAPVLRTDSCVKAAHRAIMRVLVAGMGHSDPRARRHCIRLLSGLTAGHSWDVSGPMDAQVSTVGQTCQVSVVLSDSRLEVAGAQERVRVLWFAPQWDTLDTDRAVPHAIPSLVKPKLSPVTEDGEVSLECRLPPFPRPGFYDWRVVLIDAESGQALPVTTAVSQGPTFPRRWVNCQGRWVVYHTGAAGEVGREVVLDEFGLVYDAATGEIERHGTFQDVAERVVPTMSQARESVLYVSGAIERDNGWGETPHAVEAIQARVDGSPLSSPRLRASSAPKIPPPISDVDSLLDGPTDGSGTGAFAGASFALPASMDADTHELLDPPADVDSAIKRAASSGAKSESRAPASGLLRAAAASAVPDEGDPTYSRPPPPAAPEKGGQTGASTATTRGTDVSAPAHAPQTAAFAMEQILTEFGTRAFAARPSANPLAVTDRSRALAMAGGNEGLSKLCDQAQTAGIRVVTQCTAAVSASRPHRRYSQRFVDSSSHTIISTSSLTHTLDHNGMRQPHRGTDGRLNSWSDQTLPNYRLLQTWETLAADIQNLATQCGVRGALLVDAQSWPILPQIDTTEMFRMDTDGFRHYTPTAIFEGDVVIPNEEAGYWCDFEGQLAARYANPLFLWLSRSMWEAFGDFALFGECCWGREGPMVASGVIPHSRSLPAALARVKERDVSKTGAVSHRPLKRLTNGKSEPPIAAVYGSFLRESLRLPKGSHGLIVRSLASTWDPYPSLVLGRATWPAVDILYTVPGSVWLLQGEEGGLVYRRDVTGGATTDDRFLEDERAAREERVRRRQAQREEAAAVAAALLSGRGAFSSGTQVGQASAKPLSSTNSMLFAFEGHAGVGGVIPVPVASQAKTLEVSKGASRPVWMVPTSGMSSSASSPALASMGLAAFGENEEDDSFADALLGLADSTIADGVSASAPSLDDVLGLSVAAVTQPSMLLVDALGETDSSFPHKSLEPAMVEAVGDDWKQSLDGTILADFPSDEVTVWKSSQQPESRVKVTKPAPGRYIGKIVPKVYDSDVSERLRRLAVTERAFQESVGPLAGFDLRRIRGHYWHRQLLRCALPALSVGQFVPLTARHRFGPHGHCFAFGRFFNDSIIVVAVNLNEHQSTFSVDCSPLAQAFGLPPSVDGGPLSPGGIPHADIFGVLDPSQVPVPPKGGADPYPLPGGVWEVRDMFSTALPEPAQCAALIRAPVGRRESATAAECAEADSVANDWLRNSPLVAILTGQEAAHAPMMTTLAPHRSLCWVFSKREVHSPAPRGTASAPTPVSATPPGPASNASVRWAMASSLLRLQSILRLKECGVATAVKAPLTSPLAALIAKEEASLLGGESSKSDDSRPRWIAPWSMLSDEEMRGAAKHNTVFSLLGTSVARISDFSKTSGRKLKDVSHFGACVLRSALRVLITHWGLRTDATKGVRAPCPPVGSSAAMSMAPDGEPVTVDRLIDLLSRSGLVSDVLPPLEGVSDREGGAVDPVAAAAITRSSIWHACEVFDRGVDAFEESLVWDGGISAVVQASLARVARGQASDASLADLDSAVTAFAAHVLSGSSLGGIVFASPELGKWSTVGGLGVMVDELTIGVSRLGVPVTVVSPFYNVDKKGRMDYLRGDRILFTGRVVKVRVGPHHVQLGLHAGFVRGVRLLFLHNAEIFPEPYPNLDAEAQVKQLAVFAKATLQVLCDVTAAESRGESLFVDGYGPGSPREGPAFGGNEEEGLLSDAGIVEALGNFRGVGRPAVVITNDWFTGLIPAYAREGHFGRWFDSTDFMHIAHNLDPSYEGRIYPGDKVRVWNVVVVCCCCCLLLLLLMMMMMITMLVAGLPRVASRIAPGPACRPHVVHPRGESNPLCAPGV